MRGTSISELVFDGAQAVLEYIRNCSLDLNQFDPQIPPRTYAKDLCPLSCNTCPPPTIAPSATPTSPTNPPVCADDANVPPIIYYLNVTERSLGLASGY